MLFQQITSQQQFKKWFWQDKENKYLLCLTTFVILLSFCWLKYIYPYPNFMPPDSYSYLESAQKNDFINIWPIGYSKFLRLTSSFSKSHFILITIQYLLLIAALLYFLFTIRYLLSPGKWLFRLILLISIGNPLIPHISNFVSSDCIFAAISLIWFSQLLWIIYKPSKKLLLLHAITLTLAFTIRFVALYYPLLSITIILLTHIPLKTKFVGIGAITLLILSFVGCTQYEYKIKTGTVQYSAFAGWQLAANALYGYAHAKPIPTSTVPLEFKKLHEKVNRHMDSIRQLNHRPDNEVGIYYLWNFHSPLKLYLADHWKGDTKTAQFTRWASMAPIYKQYGQWLIMKYPKEFIMHYVWPNFLKYYAPPVMFMGSYNLYSETAWPIAVTWFGWKNNQLPVRSTDRSIYITTLFPTLLSIINPIFLLASIVFVIFKGLNKSSRSSKQTLFVMWATWFTNLFFSILSAPTELRYQLFPILITIPYCGLFITWIVQSLQSSPTIQQQKRPITLSNSFE